MGMKRPMRRNSLIGPWGVGAIVPFPNDESLMIAGLDMWRYNRSEDFVIKDERLAKRIGVPELRWPPDYRERNADPDNYHISIPAVRFPKWSYCPFCGTMRETTYYETQPECDAYQWKNGRKCNPSARVRRKMIPERFIVICPEGHVDDFPIGEWVHFDSGKVYDHENCKIRRSTGGSSSGLGGVFYECSCGAKKSMAGVTKPGALKRINYKCRGSKPWLGIYKDDDSPCTCETDELRVVLRGATNVWFANDVSSIYIPTNGNEDDIKILGIVNEIFDTLNSSRIDGEFNREIIKFIADNKNVDADRLYAAVLEKAESVDGLPSVNEDTPEDEYRFAEYKVLAKSSGNDGQEFHSINYSSS